MTQAPSPLTASELTASEHNIDVWLAYYHEISNPELHAAYRALLTEEERGKEFRFYFPDDQRRYLVTRAMVRTVLSRYLAVDPRAWRFANNSYGRPAISNLSSDECGLCFNISHTKGLIAIGVTHRRELGVDVENLRTREVSLDIADRFFAEPEVAELATVPKERQQDRFFEYWTFKESYIKARGMGLSLPLDKFGFRFPDEQRVEIAISEDLADDPQRWMFWQFRPSPEYLLAICAERMSGQAPTLVFRSTVPHLHDEIVELAACRSSD